LLSITWFRGDNLIDGLDMELPLSPSYIFKTYSYTWDGIHGRESANSVTPLFPRHTFFLFCELAGLSLVTSEKILFYCEFAFGGLFMYFLTSRLIKGKERHLAGLVSALFYMLNPYTLQFKWNGLAIGPLFVYVMLPLTFYLYVRGLEGKKNLITTAIYIGLTTLMFAPSTSTPAHVIVVWLILFSYLLFDSIWNFRNKRRIIRSFGFTLLVIVVYIAFNMWWFMPTVWVTPARYESIFVSGLEAERTITSLRLESYMAGFVNTTRMWGHWGFWSTAFTNVPYYPYAHTYLTPPFVLLSFLVPILAFSSLLWSRSKYVIYFASISVLSIFLMKGIHPPFGEVYDWMFSNFPMFRIFRMQHDKFGIIQVLGYSFLLGQSVSFIYYRMASKLSRLNPNIICRKLVFRRNLRLTAWKGLIVALLFSLFVVYMLPFWTGDVIQSERPPYFKDMRVNIPAYYYEAAEWINQQNEDFKIFPLPFRKWSSSSSSAYIWGYDGGYFAKHLIHKPIVLYGIEPPPLEMTNQIYFTLQDNRSSNIGAIMGLLNVRYLLLHNDFDVRLYAQADPPYEIQQFLAGNEEFHLKKTFGLLDFYENDHFIPHIFATRNIIYTDVFGLEDFMDFNGTFMSLNPPAVFSSETVSPDALFTLDAASKVILHEHSTNDYFNNTGWEILPDISGEHNNIGTSCQHNVPNATISYTMFFPKDGTYEVYAYVRWDAYRGSLRYKLDDDPWSEGKSPYWEVPWPQYRFDLLKLGRSFITKGDHTFTIMNTWAYPKSYQNVFYLAFVPASDASEEESIASVTFERVEPTKYNIHVNASKPFMLVFSESYHPEWKAYYSDDVSWYQTLWMKPINEDMHFLVNDYANAWYIDRVGEYNITLYFKPQTAFYLGVIISTPSILACLILLARNPLAKLIKKLRKQKLHSL